MSVHSEWCVLVPISHMDYVLLMHYHVLYVVNALYIMGVHYTPDELGETYNSAEDLRITICTDFPLSIYDVLGTFRGM